MTSTPATCASSVGYLAADCPSIMTAYCSNDVDMPYLQKWQGDTFTSQCLAYSSLNLVGVCHATNYIPVVDGYVRRYFLGTTPPSPSSPPHAITFPQQGSTIYDPNMANIISACQNYPGGCDTVLTQVCATYTRDQMQANPNAATLCGCFANDAIYNEAFGVQKICNPICTLSSTVKPVDISSPCMTQKCGQSICIIDNVTVSLLAGSTAGNISFGQLCSSCEGNGGGCQCIFSDISITAVQSQVGNISLAQNCGGAGGGSTTCYKSDASGVPKIVPCADLEPNNGGGTSPASKISTATIVFIVIAVIVVVIFIIIIIYLARKKDEVSTITRQESYLAPPPGYGSNNLPAPIPEYRL